VAELLGPEWGGRIRYSEDRHMGGATTQIRGVVRSTQVVTSDLEKRAHGNPSGSAWFPVPGSGRLRTVRTADPWEPEPPDDEPDRSFPGWIVEVDDLVR
jgi:hypothetical protein